MTKPREYHFVINWKNAAEIQRLLDYVYMDEKHFIDAVVYPAYKTPDTIDRITGKTKYIIEPAALDFQLNLFNDKVPGRGSTIGNLKIEETRADPASGVAFPPAGDNNAE